MLEETLDPIEATRTSGPGTKLFDVAAALERLDGDEELFGMLAAMFHQDSVELYEQLCSGMAAGDLATAQRAAHSLKGLCANFDAKHATEAALKVEELTRRQILTGLEQRVSELGDQLGQLRRSLAQWQA